MKNTIVVLIIVLAVLALWWFSRGQIPTAEAEQLVRDGVRIVDVRTKDEYDGRHLPNAVNIPVGQLERRIGELEPKNVPVVVYCASGIRSARATYVLRDVGFTDVYDIGRMSGWPLK